MEIIILLVVVFILSLVIVAVDSYFESKKVGKRYKPYHKQLSISQLKWLFVLVVLTTCVIVFYPNETEDGPKIILSIILVYGVLIYYLKVSENLFPSRKIIKVHKALNDIGIDILKKRTEIVNGSNWLPVHFEEEWDFTHYCIDIEDKKVVIMDLLNDNVSYREIALRLIKKFAKSRAATERSGSVKEAHYKYYYDFAKEELKLNYERPKMISNKLLERIKNL